MNVRRCRCYQLMYRNNRDGTRDYKVKGKSSCSLCQGYGYTVTCDACDGAGIKNNARCPKCCGNGKIGRSNEKGRM